MVRATESVFYQRLPSNRVHWLQGVPKNTMQPKNQATYNINKEGEKWTKKERHEEMFGVPNISLLNYQRDCTVF